MLVEARYRRKKNLRWILRGLDIILISLSSRGCTRNFLLSIQKPFLQSFLAKESLIPFRDQKFMCWVKCMFIGLLPFLWLLQVRDINMAMKRHLLLQVVMGWHHVNPHWERLAPFYCWRLCYKNMMLGLAVAILFQWWGGHGNLSLDIIEPVNCWRFWNYDLTSPLMSMTTELTTMDWIWRHPCSGY